MFARIALVAGTAVAALAAHAALPPVSAHAIVPLGQFGEGPGDQAGLLDPALGVAVDGSGRVYVSELNRISVFSPRMAFLRAFGKDVVPNNASGEFEQCTTVCKNGVPGGEEGALDGAAGIATDAEGVLYVAEASNRRISVFDQQGRFVRAFGKDVDPTNAGTGPEVCTQRCQRGRPGSRSGELVTPQSVTAAAGVLWVPDAAMSRVSVFRRDGTFLRSFGMGVNRFPGGRPDLCGSLCGAGVRSGDAGALSFPAAVALDAAGNIYVSERDNRRVSVFGPNHAFRHAFGADVVPSNGQTGFEVCTPATVCKSGSTGAVFGGGGGPRPRANGPGILNQPIGIAIAPDGRIHVAETPNRRVSVFSPAPAFLGAFGKDVVPDNPVTTFEECTASCKAGAAGAGPGELANPELVAFDCRGALYVAEDANGRVQRFGEPGTEEPPCLEPAALARPFGIANVDRDPRRGDATLTLLVPWSASVRLRGRGIRPAVAQVEFRRRVRLAVRPTRATLRRLRRHGSAPVRVDVTYWPWGGTRRTKSRRIVLRLRGVTAGGAVENPSGDVWSRSVDGPITAAQLGLPAGAPRRVLGRAAIERSARSLAGGGRLGEVRFAGEPLPAGASGRLLHGLRYRQQIGGLRVLYSQLDVSVVRNRVSSIAGTVVPLKGATLRGDRRISARRARAIARRAVDGAGSARRPELVAYAGEPAAPRVPRRAYVVELAPPLSGSDESPAAICVVVDATTGNVLACWRGFAARTVKRPSARAGAVKTVLIQIVDAKGVAVADVTPNYRDVWTQGNPRSFGLDSPLQQDTFGTLSPPFFTVNSWINDVTRFFCISREYCGRDSGLDGSYNRHFYTVNWGGTGARYVHSKERIYIDVDSTTEPQTVAHEQGHSIDFHFRDDYVSTFEGDEVEEALAEMFAYDYERDRILPGATGTRVSARLADPSSSSVGSGSLPERYADYSCTTGNEHHNGYVLAHAYWRFVQRVGHNMAGHVLQGVPWQLPARREFGDVRTAMERAAGTLLVPGLNGGPPRRVSDEVAAAFGEVGVLANSRRTARCPGARP